MESNPNSQTGRERKNDTYTLLVKPSRRGLYTVIAVIVMLTVAAVFARGEWFALKEPQVTGLVSIDPEKVLARCGITRTTTYFDISEKRIRQAIEDDYRLIYIGMEKEWPDRLVIHVEERQPAVYVLHSGVQYVLALDGMVLEIHNNKITLNNGCLLVSGLDILDNLVIKGTIIKCKNAAKLEIMKNLVEELRIQQMLDQISELNIESLESIIIVTTDGFTANIGSAEELQAKIGTVHAVLNEVRGKGEGPGSIQVIEPGKATFAAF